MSIQDLKTSQLRQAAGIKEKIEALQQQLETVLTGGKIPIPGPTQDVSEPVKKKRQFSAAGLARLRAAPKNRWAMVRVAKGSEIAQAALAAAAKGGLWRKPGARRQRKDGAIPLPCMPDGQHTV